VSAVERNNVVVSGDPQGVPMVFAHGYGCDQNMWRLVAPAFEPDHRVVLFDHVGAGGTDPRAYDAERYASLDGYVEDVVAILEELDLRDAIFVGHSVSAMIGVLAARRAPGRIGRLVLVGPSPRYIDDEGYRGGFSEEDIDELLGSLASNFLGWSSAMAPVIMGNPDRPELGEELTNSFCRMDPAIAEQFARVTFRSDNRADSRADNRADADDDAADERAEAVPGQRGDRPSSGANGERPAPTMRPARLAAADGRA